MKADSVLPKPVRTPSRNTELSREEYRRANRRATRTSALVGIFLIIIFLVAVSVFIWQNFLKDIFNPPEEWVEIPQFVGQKYSDIENNDEYNNIFDFTVSEQYDDEVDEGYVISQSPTVDRKKLPASGVIEISLAISKGEEPTQTMPDVVNMDYRSAKIQLENMGLNLDVETTPEYNPDVTKDYVIETIPKSGEALSEGQTVFITYSNGPEIKKTTVPPLEGLSLPAAESRLNDYDLALGTVTYEESEDIPENQVISQGRVAGEEVPFNTAISLVVSSGPPGGTVAVAERGAVNIA